MNGWQGAAVLGLDGIAGRGGDLVNPFAVLLAPAELHRAVHGREAALAPVQTRIGEPQLDQLVDCIHLVQAEHIPIEDVDAAMRGKAVVATGVGAVVLPEGACAVNHVELVGERFVEQLLAQAVAGEQIEA